MSDLEYPRWVHAAGRKSIVAETPEDEEAFLALALPAVALVPVAAPAPPAVLPAPQRYSIVSFEGRQDGQIGGFNEEPDEYGKWVRWNDVAAMFGGNLLTDDAPTTNQRDFRAPLPVTSAATPKRTGGWPKGKPRAPKDAAVN